MPVVLPRRVIRVHGHKFVVPEARAPKGVAVLFKRNRTVPTPDHALLVVHALVFARRATAAGGDVVFHPGQGGAVGVAPYGRTSSIAAAAAAAATVAGSK